MPAYSTIKTFVKAIQSGRTNITLTLDKLMANPGGYTTNVNFSVMSTSGALNNPMPEWLRGMLIANGMKPEEADHIDDAWPDAQKELVRQKIESAITSNRPMRFFWELFDGQAPINEFQDPDASGGITVTFKSPRSGVVVSSLTYGDIKVKA